MQDGKTRREHARTDITVAERYNRYTEAVRMDPGKPSSVPAGRPAPTNRSVSNCTWHIADKAASVSAYDHQRQSTGSRRLSETHF
jgi:hypothetical protein